MHLDSCPQDSDYTGLDAVGPKVPTAPIAREGDAARHASVGLPAARKQLQGDRVQVPDELRALDPEEDGKMHLSGAQL